jgi:hypothetical protein
MRNSSLFSGTISLVFLALAYTIDYTYVKLVQESSQTLTYWPYWGISLALSASFALATILYIWYLATTFPIRPIIIPISLILSLIIFLYRYIAPLTFLNYSTLRSLPFLARLHLQLIDSNPRSFLSIATLIIALGVVITLWRIIKGRSAA